MCVWLVCRVMPHRPLSPLRAMQKHEERHSKALGAQAQYEEQDLPALVGQFEELECERMDVLKVLASSLSNFVVNCQASLKQVFLLKWRPHSIPKGSF